MKPIIFILIAVLFILSAQSQKAKQLTFTHYTMSSGLISEQVNSMVQDEDGYIWIGTNDGIQRFDGIRYKTFRHADNNPSSLSSNAVLQLLINKKKNLQVLMANGDAGIFDTKSFTFHKAGVKLKNETSLNSTVKQLITDEAGNIFLLFGGNELLT